MKNSCQLLALCGQLCGAWRRWQPKTCQRLTWIL